MTERSDIRAAISNAYYENRGKGQTMETAADAAADAVMALLAAQPGRSARDGVEVSVEEVIVELSNSLAAVAAERDGLVKALERALFQWEMYADSNRGLDRNSEPYIAEADDPEARLYQECRAALATPPPTPDGERACASCGHAIEPAP